MAKLPSVKPSPLAPSRTPKPTLPASSDTFASATSATLIAPTPSVTMFQTTRTVRRADERVTTRNPSMMSPQWPRLSTWPTWSRLAGIRNRSTAESTNVSALTQ